MKLNDIFFKTMSIFFSLALVSTQSVCHTTAKSSLSSLKNKQSIINKEQSSLNKKLKDIQSSIGVKENYKIAIENKINSIRDKIDEQNKKLDQINVSIEEKQKNIDEIQKDIDDKYNQLKKRVCAIYKAGDTSLLEILMASKNFTDLLDKADLIQRLSKYDSLIIDALNKDIQSVASEKASIEENKRQIESITKELEKNKCELEQAEKENEKNISDLKESQKETTSRLNQISIEKQQLENQISKFHEKYTKSQISNGSNVNYKNGRYTWPVPSCHVITSPFGPRWGKFHWGVDISGGGAYGASIVSACDGVVIKANSSDKWGHGYGYNIMIDHGNGYATLYAHCSTVNVSVGQHVKAGQMIGRVGNTGHSFGAHLHFETWHNGKRYNPASEL